MSLPLCFLLSFVHAFADDFSAKIGIKILESPEKCDYKTKNGDTITWRYRGTHINEEEFSQGTYTLVLGEGGMVKGLEQGMLNMCVGEERRVEIPPELGYPSQGSENIYFYNKLLELKRNGKVLASIMPKLKIDVVKKGKNCNQKSKDGDTIYWHYKGSLEDGTVFDEGDYHAKLGGGKIIKGVNDGMYNMCVGETRKLTVPAHLGYGDEGTTGIPGGATLMFVNTLTEIVQAGKTEF